MGDVVNFAPRAKTIAKPKPSTFQRMIGKQFSPSTSIRDQNKTERPSDCERSGRHRPILEPGHH